MFEPCGPLAVKASLGAGGPRHKRGVTPTSEREPGQYSWAGTGVVANNSSHRAQPYSLYNGMCLDRCVHMIFVPSGNANEPGHDDGGPGQGSLSCLTVSRKGTLLLHRNCYVSRMLHHLPD